MTILCTIDLETREVSLPAGQVIASYDHNVDVIRFQAEAIPGFSLNTSSIKIAAQGPNKARHDYAVDPSTVAIEEETGYITFDWPIPAGVTEMPIGSGFKYGDRGQLIFAVCAEIIDGSTVSKAWHSDDGIITVVAHLEPESGSGEDPEEEATNAQKIAQLQTDVAVIRTEVGALGNGSPTPVETIAEMTDESAVYLYTGSESGYTAGNWYYYDGSAWTSGGTYGGAVTDTTLSVSGMPADAKAVGDALADKADSSDVESLAEDIAELQDGGYVADQQKIAEKINDWLEEHPEATTTVEDNSLTAKKLVVGTLGYITPEDFGAKGDGVTDDTQALQDAVDSDYPVKFGDKTYLVTARIDIPVNADIDFGNAVIKTESDTIFRCEGTVKSTVTASDIASGTKTITLSGASVGDLLEITGTNSINGSRLYYVSGMTTKVIAVEGSTVTLADSVPYDITSPTIKIYPDKTCRIKNLGGIVNATGSALSTVISLRYLTSPIVDNCNFENINSAVGIELVSCYLPVVTGCNISAHMPVNTNCYPVSIGGCMGAIIRECIISSSWHSIMTGGAIPTIGTVIENCDLSSGYTVAIGEHQNAFGSKIVNTRTSGIWLSSFGTVRDCVITQYKYDTNNHTACAILLNGNDVFNADFIIDGVEFVLDGTEYISGFYPFWESSGSVQTSGIGNIYIRNVISAKPVKLFQPYFNVTTQKLVIENVDNLAFDVHASYSSAVAELVLKNCRMTSSRNLTKLTENFKMYSGHITIDISDQSFSLPLLSILEDVVMDSTIIRNSISGIAGGKMILRNVTCVTNDINSGALYVGTSEVIAENCVFPFVNYGSKNVVMKSCAVNGVETDISRIGGTSYKHGISNGTMTLTAV